MPEVFQLRVELDQVTPLVWRRLLVPSTFTLGRLHTALQACFSWNNTHLHEFQIGATTYGRPEWDTERSEPLADETRARLDRCLATGITAFEYRYDFGDDWLHRVRVEARLPAEPDLPYPLCTAGENATPPEDVGGPPGYAHFLAALANPRHPEHRDYRVWIGGAFDPRGFDLQAVNRALRSRRGRRSGRG